MDSEIGKAYEYLVPHDQLVVDSMIIALYEKEAENRRLCNEAVKQLQRANELELRLNSVEGGD